MNRHSFETPPAASEVPDFTAPANETPKQAIPILKRATFYKGDDPDNTIAPPSETIAAPPVAMVEWQSSPAVNIETKIDEFRKFVKSGKYWDIEHRNEFVYILWNQTATLIQEFIDREYKDAGISFSLQTYDNGNYTNANVVNRIQFKHDGKNIGYLEIDILGIQNWLQKDTAPPPKVIHYLLILPDEQSKSRYDMDPDDKVYEFNCEVPISFNYLRPTFIRMLEYAKVGTRVPLTILEFVYKRLENKRAGAAEEVRNNIGKYIISSLPNDQCRHYLKNSQMNMYFATCIMIQAH